MEGCVEVDDATLLLLELLEEALRRVAELAFLEKEVCTGAAEAGISRKPKTPRSARLEAADACDDGGWVIGAGISVSPKLRSESTSCWPYSVDAGGTLEDNKLPWDPLRLYMDAEVPGRCIPH